MSSTTFKLRVPTDDLEAWKRAAGEKGVSAWLRQLASAALTEAGEDGVVAALLDRRTPASVEMRDERFTTSDLPTSVVANDPPPAPTPRPPAQLTEPKRKGGGCGMDTAKGSKCKFCGKVH